MTNEPIYETETESGTLRIGCRLPWGMGKGGTLGLADATIIQNG